MTRKVTAPELALRGSSKASLVGQDRTVATLIRGPEEGRFGSSLPTADHTAIHTGRIVIERLTGYVAADLIADRMKRAGPHELSALALRFAALAGEGLGRFPLYLSSAQTHAAIDRVASLINVAQRAGGVREMHRLCAQAEEAILKARNERVIQAELDAVTMMAADIGLDRLLDTQVSDHAELAALHCDALPSEIAESIVRVVGEARRASIRQAAERGARRRKDCRQAADDLFDEHALRREEQGLPIFETYDVDPQTNAPDPAEYADEQAEREEIVRRAACEQVIGAVESRLRSSPNLSAAEVLAEVRYAARESDSDVIGRVELGRRLISACHAEPELRHAIEMTIEFVRDDGGRSSDKEIEELIRDEVDQGTSSEVIDASVTIDDDVPSVPLPPPRKLSDLTRPPGLVGEIVDWIEASAEFPSRELALGAALGWVAAVAGRGFETPSRARTNLYTVALAPSGYGKDHAPSCIISLAQAAGLDRFLGPARFMSASALRNELNEQPTMLAIQDEYGGILRQIDGPKVGIHNEMIRYDLLGLFSRAKDHYAGAAYASMRAIKLYNPNLCVFGMSTPEDFWSALSSSRTADGFLARFLLFNVEGKKPRRTMPTACAGKPPPRLIDGTRAIYQAVYGRRNMLGLKDGSAPFSAETVNLNDGARNVLQALEAKLEGALALADAKAIPFWNRVYEHALKLALTVAVGVTPSAPLITAEIMSWAADLAWTSTSTLAREAENRIADNERQRSFNRVLEIVRKAGSSGLSLGKIVDKLGGTLDKRTRTELIEEAEQSGRILAIPFKPPTGRPGYRFVASEFRPEAFG